MKMNMDLYGSDGVLIDLEFTDLDIISHMTNPTSYIQTIVDEQINRDKIYDFFFAGKNQPAKLVRHCILREPLKYSTQLGDRVL